MDKPLEALDGMQTELDRRGKGQKSVGLVATRK